MSTNIKYLERIMEKSEPSYTVGRNAQAGTAWRAGVGDSLKKLKERTVI